MACDATTLIANAYANGYAKMSDRDLKMATVASACAATGGIGGSGQMLFYTVDPNLEGLVPANPANPGIAYPRAGGTQFQWDPDSLTWV